MTNEQTIEKTKKAPARPPSYEPGSDWWDAKTIADFLKVSPDYVTQKICNIESFPRPVRFKTGKGRGHPRWKGSEIMEWVDQQERARK